MIPEAARPTLMVSVVLPAKDEAGNIAALLAEISSAMTAIAHEIIVVDDGSTDATAAAVLGVAAQNPTVRLLRHGTSSGQSAAIRSGVTAARGRIIATLDADGQNPPAELPHLVAPFLEPGANPRLGLVQGQRLRRQDTLAKRLASRAANAIRGGLLRDGVRDSGCGLKAFPRDTYLALAYFDHIHRFMGAMVKREGYEVMVIDVRHRERGSGQSKYNNFNRAMVGIVDLLGVAWLARRRKLPGSVHETLAAGVHSEP